MLFIENEFSSNSAHKQVIARCEGFSLVAPLTEDFGFGLSNGWSNSSSFFGEDGVVGRAVGAVSNMAQTAVSKTTQKFGADSVFSKNAAIMHWEDSERFDFDLEFLLVTYEPGLNHMAKLRKALELCLPSETGSGVIGNTAETLMNGRLLRAPAGYGITSTQQVSGGVISGTWDVQVGEYFKFNELVCTSINWAVSKERIVETGEPLWVKIVLAFKPARLPLAENVAAWFMK